MKMSNSSNNCLCLLNLSIFTPLYLSFLFLHLTILITGDSQLAYSPPDNTALDCGSSSENLVNGRTWIADINTKSALLDQKNPSNSSTAINHPTGAETVPHITARLSGSQFYYTFPVTTAGPKFVRLHFFPASYPGFNSSDAFFSVTIASDYTLLGNFSAALHVQAPGKVYFREYCLNIEDDQKNIIITFTPNPDVTNSYAFIDGIEIVSMPPNLYYFAANDRGFKLVGQENTVLLPTTTALELMYQINVAGSYIDQHQDTSMLRSWSDDVDYLTDARPNIYQYNGSIQLSYFNHITRNAAPQLVYRTARSMSNVSTVNENYNLTWEFPVHSTFIYLVRLHFCLFIPLIMQLGDEVFNIYITNQTAELNADVISWTGAIGVAIYKYYAVVMDAKGSERNRIYPLH